MASQEIEYAAGNDTGERVDTSIAPLLPGEIVKSAVANRRTECLRNRSEVLRDELIDQKYLQDTDISWFIAEGDDITGDNAGVDLPTILWDPAAGQFVVGPAPTAVLLLQPLKTTKDDSSDAVVYTFVTDSIRIGSIFRNYEGANRREVRWVWTPMAGASAVLSGTPNHILTISVDSGGTTQVTDVDNALLALGGALAAAGFAHSVAGGGDFIVAPPADYAFTKNFEREMHRIPASQFVAFFAVPANALEDGDTLAVYYEYMIDPGGTSGRRQSCPTNANISITWGQLFITTHEPEKLPFCVPICKRIGDDLIFLDGTICYGNMTPSVSPIFAGEHGYTVNRIINAASSVLVNIVNVWADTVAPTGATGTINAALNGIVGDLAGVGAGTDGAGKVGAETVAGSPSSLATTTAGGQLAELLSLTNDRIKTYHPTASSTSWICLWRSNNISNPSFTTKDTLSLWWKNGSFSLVGGAYWTSGTQVTAGLVGTATDVVVSIWTSSGMFKTFVAMAPPPGTPLSINTPADWTTYDMLAGDAVANVMYGTQKTFNCDIKYGQDYVTLRADFSTTDWHLVYRNSGRTTTPDDVGWDTLSVYEKVDTNVASGRLEIYGGYLSAANTITSAPLGAGTGTVSFDYFSNSASGTIVRSGIRIGLAGNVSKSITTSSDWDLYDVRGEVGGVLASILYGRSATDYQCWYIRNKFMEPIEINDVSELNACLTLGDGVDGFGEFESYFAGATVPSGKLALLFRKHVFLAPMDPTIWYDANDLYMTTNAYYNNSTELWGFVTTGTPATGLWLRGDTGKIYQLCKHSAVPGTTWDNVSWDVYQELGDYGNKSQIYLLGTLADGVATPTTIPDTLCGLFVVNMTFKGQRRCGVYRMDGSGIYLVSGNEDAGAAVWSDVISGLVFETCQLYVNAGFVVLANGSAADHMTNIRIGAYLGFE